jgi:hypothetical protein
VTSAGGCRFLQRNDDRRQIFVTVDADGRRVAFGPLGLDEVDCERYVVPGGLVWRGLGDEALARDLSARAGEFHDLDDFYRAYGYPADILDWVEATDLRFGREVDEVADRLGLDVALLDEASWQEAHVQGSFDPEGNYLFHHGFGDNWAIGDLSGRSSINPNNYRFKAWLSFHT